ncbi:hypothetical protein DSO57_1018377 [Entomophthora muscae]|uniref:Uncharacterized protein n=1 Tax=Entomophthora muscae TaxID=34485 RepID=A0ACC2T468_9FUNG|nr:hypothetical protein DSO57_1018377 [Entomophthora muscae]
MPVNFVAPPSIPEDENRVTSQCPEFYAEDALMLSQVIYLGLLWLGLIVLLNPGVTIGKFTKKYLKPETASYYPVISVTLWLSKPADYFLANELSDVVAGVCLHRLGYWPPCREVNGCDDVFFVVVLSWHGAHNVKSPYFGR